MADETRSPIRVRRAPRASPKGKTSTTFGTRLVRTVTYPSAWRARPLTDHYTDLFIFCTAATEVLEKVVDDARELGYFEQSPHHPKVSCDCAPCRALRLLASVGARRCILCGCSEDHACQDGCSWANQDRLVCDAHPPAMIRAALRAFAKEEREKVARVPRG